MSVDFNHILAAILGNNQLLRDELGDRPETLQTLAQVSKAAQRGQDLVCRILAFGLQQGVTREPVDVVALVKHTHSLLGAR